MALILKVNIYTLFFRLIYIFIEMFDSPRTRVLFSLTIIAFFSVFFYLTQYVYNTFFSNIRRVGSGSPQASSVGSLETIFGSFDCYLLSHRVRCYMLSGF